MTHPTKEALGIGLLLGYTCKHNIQTLGDSTTLDGWRLHQALSKLTSNYLLSVLPEKPIALAGVLTGRHLILYSLKAIREALEEVPHLYYGFRWGNPGVYYGQLPPAGDGIPRD
jgi:hypothetical protein